MRRAIYEFIEEKILAITDDKDQSVIQHVDIWNNQTEVLDEEVAFALPAVFIEFGDINWKHLRGGKREADVTITLHILTDSRTQEYRDNIAVFDLLDGMYRQLHGANGNQLGTFTLINSITDNNFDEVMHNQETYITHVIE